MTAAELLAGLRDAASRRDRALRSRDADAARRSFLAGTRVLAEALGGKPSAHLFKLIRLAQDREATDCPPVEAWRKLFTCRQAQPRYVRTHERTPLAILAHPRGTPRDLRARLSCGLQATALPVLSWWSRASTPIVIAGAGDERVWAVIDALDALVREQEAE